MKNLTNKFMALCLMASACIVATSCSDDKDEPSLPTYAQEAAKYNLTANALNLKSIEFCADGEYIVVNDNSQSVTPGTNPSAAYQVGKFTINADNSLSLSGFGKVTINQGSLTVAPNSGAPTTITASKAPLIADTPVNMQLCRTWNNTQFGLALSVGSATTYNQIGSIADMLDTARGYFNAYGQASGGGTLPENLLNNFVNNMKQDMPVKVTLTRAGTLLELMNDASYRLFSWTWADAANQIIQTTQVGVGITSMVPANSRMVVSVNSSTLLLQWVQVENAGQTPEICTTYTWGYTAQ